MSAWPRATHACPFGGRTADALAWAHPSTQSFRTCLARSARARAPTRACSGGLCLRSCISLVRWSGARAGRVRGLVERPHRRCPPPIAHCVAGTRRGARSGRGARGRARCPHTEGGGREHFAEGQGGPPIRRPPHGIVTKISHQTTPIAPQSSPTKLSPHSTQPRQTS